MGPNTNNNQNPNNVTQNQASSAPPVAPANPPVANNPSGSPLGTNPQNPVTPPTSANQTQETDVLGIVSIVMFVVFAPAGIIIGIIGRKKALRLGYPATLSTIGIWINVANVALWLLLILFFAYGMMQIGA